MNRKRRHVNIVKQPFLFPQILLLALFFLVGVVLGQVFAGRVPAITGQELTNYLHHYLTLEEENFSPKTLLAELVLYLRYPLLAVLLGFSSIGVVVLPGATILFGFFLSFSISCFIAAFGVNGVLVALAVAGLRCAVTLPCYFVLAVPAWSMSVSLASFGRGQKVVPVTYGRSWWLCLGVCIAVLLAGMCVDYICSPWFLHLALDRILI